MADIPALYPHDKAEGIAIINSTTIAISNDDYFGVVGAGGVYAQKLLPATGGITVTSSRKNNVRVRW